MDYETFRPEERESGAVIRESHLENVLWEMELALLQSDVAMEALEDMKAIIKKRLVGLRVESRSEIVPTIEKALKASLVELLSKNVFNPDMLLEQYFPLFQFLKQKLLEANLIKRLSFELFG